MSAKQDCSCQSSASYPGERFDTLWRLPIVMLKTQQSNVLPFELLPLVLIHALCAFSEAMLVSIHT